MNVDDLNQKLLDAGEVPVVLFFGSRACGPTISMFPVLDEFEDTTSAPIIALEVEKAPEATKLYNIRATPTVIVVRNGDPLGNLAGTMTAAQMVEWYERMLAPKKAKKARKKKEPVDA